MARQSNSSLDQNQARDARRRVPLAPIQDFLDVLHVRLQARVEAEKVVEPLVGRLELLGLCRARTRREHVNAGRLRKRSKALDVWTTRVCFAQRFLTFLQLCLHLLVLLLLPPQLLLQLPVGSIRDFELGRLSEKFRRGGA